MGETSLHTIISLIERQDEVKLREALEEDNSEINQYHEMPVDSKLAVRVSPLHFAVKVKAPRCVEVLLEFGADVKMKLKTTENKSLPITALQLAEGERDVAIKNERDNDIAIYDDIVLLIKEHEKKKRKKKKPTQNDKHSPDPELDTEPFKNGVEPEIPAGSKDFSAISNSMSLGNFDKLGKSDGTAGGDLVTSASTGGLSTSMPTFLVPPSPSSSLDMHKLTLKAAQNQLAIKKLEEKNEILQKEIEALRQDMELLKKLVVNIDGLAPATAFTTPTPPIVASTVTAAPEGQEAEKSKRKTVAVTKTSSEKTIPKTSTKDRKKPINNATTPVKKERDDDDDSFSVKNKRNPKESEKQTLKQDKSAGSVSKGSGKKTSKKSQ